MTWLRGLASEEDAVAFQMSFLEIAVYLCSGQVTFNLPVPNSQRRHCWVDSATLPASLMHRPTVAAILRLTQNFFAALDDCFDFGLPLRNQLDLTQYGVMPPQRGVVILLGRSSVNMMGSLLASFTVKRPIRRAGDLSRPFR